MRYEVYETAKGIRDRTLSGCLFRGMTAKESGDIRKRDQRFFLYANFGRPFSSGTLTLPWISGRA